MKRGVIVSKAATGRLTMSFSYNQEHIAKVKTIPGHKWYIRTSSVMNELCVMPLINWRRKIMNKDNRIPKEK